jgi:hypothetical protein
MELPPPTDEDDSSWLNCSTFPSAALALIFLKFRYVLTGRILLAGVDGVLWYDEEPVRGSAPPKPPALPGVTPPPV